MEGNKVLLWQNYTTLVAFFEGPMGGGSMVCLSNRVEVPLFSFELDRCHRGVLDLEGKTR